MSQAQQSNDGCYRFIISTRDPGFANWLDPAGASTVFAFLRWQGLPTDYKFDKKPSTKVVDFDELGDWLPDEPTFGPEERVEQLATRQASSLGSPRGLLGFDTSSERCSKLNKWSGLQLGQYPRWGVHVVYWALMLFMGILAI